MTGLVIHTIRIFCDTYFWHSWLSSILKIVSSTPDPGWPIKFPPNSSDGFHSACHEAVWHKKYIFAELQPLMRFLQC